MLEQLKYKNHMNEVFEFGKDGIFVNMNDLRDYGWTVVTKGNRIAALNRSISKKKLPIIIICDTEEKGVEVKNKLLEVVEKDVLAMEHGKIILGNYYFQCFVTKSQKKNYLTSKRWMQLTLTLTTDFPYWVKETTTPYGIVEDEGDSEFLDYNMDFPIDYFSDRASKQVVNTNFVASNFRLIIYGPCVNPSVSIAGHVYQVNCTVDSNEFLTIDSSTKKIFLTANDGTVTNKFNDRYRASYIFEKIPTGSNIVAWNGDFAFDVILLEERSEPKWT